MSTGLSSRLRLGPWPLTRVEISGGLADLGVLVPLEVSLIALNGLNPTSTLLGVGIAYMLAGLYFRIPMPVQPLKAFAIIAIAHQLAPSTIAAGALLMALAMAVLGATGLVNLLARLVPTPVVRGVQAGLGLLLIKGAWDMFWRKPFFFGGERLLLEEAGLSVPLGLVVGLAGVVFILLALRWKHLPTTASLLALGALVGLGLGSWTAFRGITLGPMPVQPALPELKDFTQAATLLVIPQLALSLTNSVIATVDVAHLYFPQQAGRVTPKRVALSYALGNLWAGFFGGLPMCHGSGGLTAHYRLGARTPAATLFVGALLIVVALLFGRAAMPIRTFIPVAVFGALLFYVGWQHLLLGLKVAQRHYLTLVALVAVVSILPGSNLAIGAGAGLVAWWGGRAIWRFWQARRWRAALPWGTTSASTKVKSH